jgi:hypothetical protein
VVVGVYDCSGKPVADARVELTTGGQPVPNAIPFQIPASRIPDAQPMGEDLYTQSSGVVGFLNVPSGFVALTAFQRDGTRIGRVQLGALPGVLTIGSVRPDSSRNADLSYSTPLQNPDANTAN